MTLLGVGEILAITGIVLQVLTAVDQVSRLFDRLHNAPRHIRNFKVSAARLEFNFKCLKVEVESHGKEIHIPDADYEEIHQILQACQVLLRKYENTLRSEGAVGGVRRAFWSFTSGQELDGRREQIDRIYVHIIQPVWLRLISARQRSHTARIDSIHHSSALQYIWTQDVSALTVGPAHVTPGNEPCNSTVSQGPITEQELREIDQRVREYTTILGVAVDPIMDDSLIMNEDGFDHVPTTLNLENVPRPHRRLMLQEIQIMAKDQNTRVLHFRNHDQSIRVKHLIPFGSIPFTADKDSLEVTFFATHTITVVDYDGHHLYHVQRPRYHFSNLKSRRKFQEFALERELLGEVEAVTISSDARLLARCQVVRVWRETSPDLRPRVTMTFLATSVGERTTHTEWNIEDFNSNSAIKTIKKRKILNLYSLYSQSGFHEVSIEFADANDAKKLKLLFDSHYPPKYSNEAPRLELSPAFSESMSSLAAASAYSHSDLSWGEIGSLHSDSIESYQATFTDEKK